MNANSINRIQRLSDCSMLDRGPFNLTTKPRQANTLVHKMRHIPYMSVGSVLEHFASHLVSKNSTFQRVLPAAPEITAEKAFKANIQRNIEFALSGPVMLLNGNICQGTLDGIICFSFATGELIWSVPLQGSVDSVLSVDDLVLTGSRDGFLTALNAKDGVKQWEVSAESWVSGITYDEKDFIVFGSRDGQLRCVSKNGEMRWACNLGARILASPCIDKDRVFVGARNGLFYSVDLLTGRIIGTLETGSDVHGAATVFKSHVIFGSDDKRLYCVDRGTLEVQWMFRTGDAIWSKPIVINELVVFGSTDSYIYGLDIYTGVAKWEVGTTAPVRLGLSNSNELICVANEKGKILFIDFTAGTVIGIGNAGGPVWAAPIELNGGFLVTQRENELRHFLPYFSK